MNILFNEGQPTNYIWIAPPRTGTRGTDNVFRYNNFHPKIEGVGDPQFSGKTFYTHSNFILGKYLNNKYDIICNARNPYHRVLSEYNNIVLYNNQKVQIDNAKDSSIEDIILYFFLDGKKPEKTQSVKVNPCFILYETFEKYVDVLCSKQNLYTPCPLRFFKNVYPVRTEYFIEDLKKIPFVKNIPNNIIFNAVYFHDRKRFIRNHFINNILKNEIIDKDVYINFIQKNLKEIDFVVSDNKQIYIDFLQKFERRLSTITSIEIDEFIELVTKTFIRSEDFKSKSLLYDLSKINIKVTNSYNDSIADKVFKSYEDWFINFEYKKDSWNTDIIL